MLCRHPDCATDSCSVPGRGQVRWNSRQPRSWPDAASLQADSRGAYRGHPGSNSQRWIIHSVNALLAFSPRVAATFHHLGQAVPSYVARDLRQNLGKSSASTARKTEFIP